MGHQVLGEVEGGVGEEPGVGQPVALHHRRAVALLADYAAPVPGRRPEASWVLDRPTVQVPIPALDAGYSPEVSQTGGGRPGLGGLPHRVGHPAERSHTLSVGTGPSHWGRSH